MSVLASQKNSTWEAQSLGWQLEALRSVEKTRSRWSLLFLTRFTIFGVSNTEALLVFPV